MAAATTTGWSRLLPPLLKSTFAPVKVVTTVPKRYIRYNASPKVSELSGFTEYETVSSPSLWRHVEVLLAPRTVPRFVPKAEYPSGWTPAEPELSAGEPYFVKRTLNHMLPVYLNLSHRGGRRITKIKQVTGDIVALEREIKQHLLDKRGLVVPSVRHEIGCHIDLKGDHFYDVEEFLLAKGF